MTYRPVCCIHTKRQVWYDGKHYLDTVMLAKHSRIDALIEANDKLLNGTDKG